MESKTIKHLKIIAELKTFNTNPIIRLHYRSAHDIASKSSESLMTKTQSDLECRFCYSKSPSLKVISRFGRAKKPNKKSKKQVIMLCRICRNKYPKENVTTLNNRETDARQ